MPVSEHREWHDYAVRDCLDGDMERFDRAAVALENALGCDAYPEEITAARIAAMNLADEANRLAGAMRRLLDRRPRHAG